MNKFLSILMAFATVTLFSCGIDDDTEGGGGSSSNLTVSYTVNTQPLYDTFGITSDMETYLQTNQINIDTYVYDASGNLVMNRQSLASNFSPVTQAIVGLSVGDYTFVTVESAYHKSGTEHTPWTISGSDKLSTLVIEPIAVGIGIKYAIGVSTQQVTISGNQSVSATPKAIGSRVNVKFDDFTNSSLITEAFGSTNWVESYSLDPSVADSKKYSYNPEDTVFCIRGEVTTTESASDTLSIYVLDRDITWMFCFQTEEEANTDYWYTSTMGWESLEDGATYYCGIKYVSESASPKTYFGDKAGYEDWQNGVVTFKEPCISWGARVSEVNDFMDGYSLYKGSATSAEYDSEYDQYYTSWDGKNAELSFVYYFTSRSKGLYECDVYYDGSEVGDDQMMDYLNNKYIYLAEDSGVYEFYTSDEKTIIGLIEFSANENSYWVLMYVDADMVTPSSAKSAKVKSLAKANGFAANLRRYSSAYNRRKIRRNKTAYQVKSFGGNF